MRDVLPKTKGELYFHIFLAIVIGISIGLSLGYLMAMSDIQDVLCPNGAIIRDIGAHSRTI
jgi:Na+/H+-dicarboxylate symporter